MKKGFAYSRQIHHVWILLRQTCNLMPKYLEPLFTDAGITYQQYMVLFSLKLLDSPVTISDVAHNLDRNVNSISTIIERMYKDGLVKRTRDLADRRTVRLKITSKGEGKLKVVSWPYWEMVAKLLSHFSNEELQTMERLTNKLKRYMADEIGTDRVAELHTEVDPDKVARVWAEVNSKA